MRLFSDDELLERSVSGDEHALAILFDRYYQVVFRFAQKIQPNGTEAEDITQEVFVRLIKCIGSFDKRSAFSSWLYRITLNIAIDARRREERRIGVVRHYGQLECTEDRPKQELEVLAQQIIDIVIEFPQRERDAVLLVCAEGLTQKEAAAIIGCPLGSIGGLLASATRRLNRIFESQQDGPKHDQIDPQPRQVALAFARC